MNSLIGKAHPLRLLLVSEDLALHHAVQGALVTATQAGYFQDHVLSVEDGSESVVYQLTEAQDCILLDAAFLRDAPADWQDDIFVDACRNAPIIVLTDAEEDLGLVRAHRVRMREQWRKDGSSGAPLVKLIRSVLPRPSAEVVPPPPQPTPNRLQVPDRMLFIQRLEEAVAQSQRLHRSFCVLLIQLAVRKDSPVSQEVALQEVFAQVSGVVRQSDTVARLGDNELAALVTVANIDGAQRLARKMTDVIHAHPAFGGAEDGVGVAAGVALYPQHGNTREELLRAADGAVYAARRDHVAYVVAPEHDKRWHDAHQSLGGTIGSALAQNEFVLKYQPQINLATGQVEAVEALVRWHHPELGLLPPAEFLPLAAQDQSIDQLSLKIMESALDQVRQWRDQGLRIPLSVNLPQSALLQEGLCERIQTKLRQHDLASGALTLELRDENLANLSIIARAVLQRLANLGVRVAIDDFGRGQASLLVLRDMPVQELKLDSGFCVGLRGERNDAAILSVLLEMGRQTGRRIVAKGVESEAVWQELVQLGCEYGQGFCFAPPLDPAELPAWIEDWQRQTPPGQAVQQS